MNEPISAFAYQTGREIERMVKDYTDDLSGRNDFLQAKILEWYQKTKDEEFASFFGITKIPGTDKE